MGRTKLSQLIAAGTLAFAMALTPTISASAASAAVWQGTASPNTLYQFSYAYGHRTNTGVTFSMTHLQPCGGEMRLGLRYGNGTQFTHSQAWNGLNTKSFYMSSNGSSTITATTFYLNGRLIGTCSAVPPSEMYFSGRIVY